MSESPGTVVREMSEYIEALLGEGDWSEVEDMLVRLRGALLNVPEAERRELLVVAQQSTDRVAAEAEKAREALASRLSTLKRGRRARTAYENS
ncbi:MAG: hypothetical protein AAFX10_02695 [Pseudomonadota bacterium]